MRRPTGLPHTGSAAVLTRATGDSVRHSRPSSPRFPAYGRWQGSMRWGNRSAEMPITAPHTAQLYDPRPADLRVIADVVHPGRAAQLKPQRGVGGSLS